MNCLVLTIMVFFMFIKNRLLSQKFEKQKNYFVQTLKHDLRVSTLAQIRGIELLSKIHCTDTTCRELTSEIDKSCRYTLDMISVLLNIIEFNAGKNTLNYDNFNLSELLADICINRILKLTNKNIEIINDDNNIFIDADKHLLLKTLLAILSTVFNYANNNSKINIKTENKKDMVNLSIIYSGLPISEEYNKMFSKNSYFSTVGQGIKMYMCKQIIEFHHGKIQFINGNENLNEFSILLPSKQHKTHALIFKN